MSAIRWDYASFKESNTIMKKSICLLFLICLIHIHGFAQNESLKVQKWNPTDLKFKTEVTWRFSPTDPFEIDFYAEITGPDNIKLTLPGFYSGEDTWIIRFSPTREGEWNITTQSEVIELDKQQVKIECIKNDDETVHGRLLVDPENPHHFIYEDGTRWFPMGYEANWLFAMDMDVKDNTLPTLNPFLDKLSKYGFNFILINAWAYDTSWRLGKTSDDDYGPPLLFPWGGSHESPDFKKFNLEYWQHFDQVIEALYQRGIVAHLYLKVYNKLVNWPQNTSAEDDLYYRWIIARYAAYPNIIWNLSKEAQYEKSFRNKVERLKYIRSTDPYNRLLTVHDDRLTYDKGHYDELVDFRSSQEHSDVHATMLRQLAGNAWPVFNVESGYEHGPKGLDDRAFGRSNTPEQVIDAIWKIQMAGVYNAYYYTYAAWDVIRPDDNPPGYEYIKNFVDFFAKTQYWLLKSDDILVSSGHCLANPGKEYIVYQDEAIPFTLNLSGLTKPLQAVWYQPLSGEYLKAGKFENGTAKLKPPATLGKGPVVLHLK
jgi:hypothetical protein